MRSDSLWARGRRAFGCAYPPDIHLVGGRNPFHEINEPAIRRPSEVVAMVTGSFHVNLPGATSVGICDKYRIAGAGSVPGDPAPVRGPCDFHRAGDERVRRAAHHGSQPPLIGSGAIALHKPDMGVIRGKCPASESGGLQIPESSLGDVHKLAATDLAYPHIEAAVRSETNEMNLPSGEIAASTSSPSKSVTRSNRASASGLRQK